MKPSLNAQRNTAGRAVAQGRNPKSIREPRGNSPQLARTINQIEARTAMPFEQWLHRVTSNPVCAVVHREHADCFVIKLVNITGRVLVDIPVKRAFYDAIHEAVAARGVAMHQFIMEAVDKHCARLEGGKR